LVAAADAAVYDFVEFAGNCRAYYYYYERTRRGEVVSSMLFFIFFQIESPHMRCNIVHCLWDIFGRTISPFLADAEAVAGTELLDLGVAATGGLALAREEAVGAIK